MKREKALIERIVLESSDFKKLGIYQHSRLENSDYYLLGFRNKRYIVHRRRNNEYVVVGIYVRDNNGPDLQKMREGACV